jgi:hypothetical protein
MSWNGATIGTKKMFTTTGILSKTYLGRDPAEIRSQKEARGTTTTRSFFRLIIGSAMILIFENRI